MGIGRDLNHPPTKWEFMLQILNSSRCPEKKGNCTVLSTCFFQLRFGFLKLKLQLTLKQTNIRNGTPPVSHQSFRRFNYLFFPPVMRLQIHCLDVPIAPAKRKKNCQVWQWISQVLFSKWQFLNWDFKKSDQKIFLGWKKNHFRHCAGLHAKPFKHPPDAETELPCCGASLLCRPCRKRWAGEFAHYLVTSDPHSAVESIFS